MHTIDTHNVHPKLEKISSPAFCSIAVKREITPYMDYPLHYHPEYEIIYVQKSHGLRLMGNHIGNFKNGDLVFIGSNLPHVWKNDLVYYQGNEKLKVDVFVIQFLGNALGDGFIDLPEFAHVKKLFSIAQQGMRFKGKDKMIIAGLIKKVYFSSGIDRLIFFLKTLDALACSKHYELLSSPGYANFINDADTVKIDKIVNYCLNNYFREIRLDVVANLVTLNKSSFCRYFKSRTHKTFSEFLNEIRIAKACKLLIEREKTVSEICYETGFNNISHFNRRFKLITGLTATKYVKKYLQNLSYSGTTLQGNKDLYTKAKE